MISIFFVSFGSMFSAIAQIFIVMGLAAVLLRRRMITGELITGLSQLTVVVLLPCLTFVKIVRGYHPGEFDSLGLIFAFAVGTAVLGMLFSLALFGVKRTKHYLMAMSSLQNCAFFVLVIGQMVYPNQFDQFALYVFLYSLVFNPLLWSLGKVLITDNTDIRLKSFITPPFLANIAAILVVYSGVVPYIPELVLGPMDLLGSAAVPVATFVLGATLGSASLKGLPPIFDIIKMNVIRFFLVPLSIVIILLLLKLKETNPLMSDFLVIEAAAAPATAHILLVRKYGGEEAKIGSLMFLSYIICLFMLPIWLAVWKIL